MAGDYTIKHRDEFESMEGSGEATWKLARKALGTSAFGFNLVEIGPGGRDPRARRGRERPGRALRDPRGRGGAADRRRGPPGAGRHLRLDRARRPAARSSTAPTRRSRALLIGVQPEGGYEPMSWACSSPETRTVRQKARFTAELGQLSAPVLGPRLFAGPIIRRLVNPSRARSKKARKPGGHMPKHQSGSGASVKRYSPELPYKPLVSPPSVEDKDACAIYASVRKDATPSHEPIELAIPALQKMLHRAGNVDGEGDGCGLLLDLPRKIWAEEVRSGGHDPSLTLDDAFAVAHIFIERSQDLDKIQHDARELLNEGGFRVLAERIGVVDSPALGPTAREEEPHFWQIAGLVPDAAHRDRVLFELLIELEKRLDVHVPSFSATTCVYKVMGAPNVLGEYYPDLRDERFETIGCFGHNRYSTNTWPSFKRVQPFSALGHNGEINTIEQLRQEARMLGVPIQPGSSDSQDLNRTIDTLVSREGFSLAEAMEMVVPPIVEEIRALPEDLHRFYMYLHQAMGPFAQGPVALIARHADECVFSADALGLRPLWQVETEDDFVFSSEPGVVSVHSMVSEPKPLAPGEKALVADRPRAQALDPARPRRDAADRPRQLAAAQRRRGGGRLRPRPGDRRAAGGRRRPRLLRRRPRGAGQGRRPHPRRLRLAARRRQTGPADGLQRGRADRLARLRRAAGGALARAPEPRRLLQGDGRRRHQPGDRPRARDRALLDPGAVRPPPLARRRRRGHRHGRNRVPGDPRRPPRPGAALRQDLPPDRPRAPHLPARGPLGGVPRPRRRGRHLPAGVRDDPRRDRADQAGSGEEGPQRGRAAGPHRPHRLRRRAPLPRPAPGDLGGRPGAEAVPGRARRGEPAPPLRDRPALGGDPQRPRHDAGPRPRRQRRLPVHDGRGDLRRGLRDRRLQPLRGPDQGDRESDLDDRHPRGARLRPPVLLDRGQAGAGRDLPDRGLRRLGERRHRLRRPRRGHQRPRPGAQRRRRGGQTGEDVPLLPEGLQGGDRHRQRLRHLRGVLARKSATSSARARSRCATSWA